MALLLKKEDGNINLLNGNINLLTGNLVAVYAVYKASDIVPHPRWFFQRTALGCQDGHPSCRASVHAADSIVAASATCLRRRRRFCRGRSRILLDAAETSNSHP